MNRRSPRSARPVAWVLLIVLAAPILAACSQAVAPTAVPPPQPTQAPAQPATAPPQPSATPVPKPTDTPKPKSLTIGLHQEPDILNWDYTNEWVAQLVIETINPGLFNWDDKNQIFPELAAEVPSQTNGGISADNKTITLKLRPGLKWHDGTPLTSADLKFTWQAVMNEKNTVASRDGYDQIAGIDTPDDTTAVVHFQDVYAPWASKIFRSIMPAHILGSMDSIDKADWNRAPIGAGPYKFVEWVSGDHITVAANPDYWRGRPKLDRIIWKIYPDVEGLVAAVKTGDVDIGVDFTEAKIPEFEQLAPKVRLVTLPTGWVEHYLFNLGPKTGPPFFQDVNVRKAIALAIDRQTIVDKLLFGKTKVARTFWDNTYWENTAIKALPYDPEQAKKLLDDAGWKVGPDGIRAKGGVKLSFTHTTQSGNQLREDVQLLVQQNLKDAGIEMKIQNVPADTLFAGFTEGGPVASGTYQMAGYTDGAFPDPDNGGSNYWTCGQIPTADKPDGTNWYRVCNPELDKLFEQAVRVVDPAERKKLYDQIQQIMADNVYIIPMYDRLDIYTAADRVVGFQPGWFSSFYWNIYAWDVK